MHCRAQKNLDQGWTSIIREFHNMNQSIFPRYDRPSKCITSIYKSQIRVPESGIKMCTVIIILRNDPFLRKFRQFYHLFYTVKIHH